MRIGCVKSGQNVNSLEPTKVSCPTLIKKTLPAKTRLFNRGLNNPSEENIERSYCWQPLELPVGLNS